VLKGKKDAFTRDYAQEERVGELAPHSHQNFMNVGNPGEAFVGLPQRWVGLARLEFIIANHIQVHP